MTSIPWYVCTYHINAASRIVCSLLIRLLHDGVPCIFPFVIYLLADLLRTMFLIVRGIQWWFDFEEQSYEVVDMSGTDDQSIAYKSQ